MENNCPVCNGRKKCSYCRGDGKVEGTKCAICGGTGNCSRCGGSGERPQYSFEKKRQQAAL